MSVVRFEQKGAVGRLILDADAAGQPGADMASTLRAAIRTASASDIRVLHLTSSSGSYDGAGDAVAVGAGGSRPLEAFAADIQAAVRTIEELPIPTVATVAGMAVGGGFELLLGFDFLIVGESTTLVFPEVSAGLFPLAGGVQRLADRVGAARARRFVLLSEPLSGKTAVDLGVATHVAPDAELDRFSTDFVQRLASGPTLAYGKARALIRAWSTGGVPAADIITHQLTTGILDTEDAAHGMKVAAEAVAKHEPIPAIEFAGR